MFIPERALNILPYHGGARIGYPPYTVSIGLDARFNGFAYGEAQFSTLVRNGFLNFRLAGTSRATTYGDTPLTNPTSNNRWFFGEKVVPGQPCDIMCKLTDFYTDESSGYAGAYWGLGYDTWAPMPTDSGGMGIMCSGQNFVGQTYGTIHFALAGTENIPELHFLVSVALSVSAG